MAAITKIELWKDVGFIDGAVEIPNLSAADPVNPDFTIEPTYPIIPSKERMFSEFKLKEYFSELMTCSYMRITYLIKNSLGVDTPKIFYGWITDVVLTSDAELPVTTISWHIDEWRTWKANVTFGSGHIKRRPFKDQATTPIQNFQYKFEKLDSTNDLNIITPKKTVISGVEYSVYWVVFSYNRTYTAGNDSYTAIDYCAFPVGVHVDRSGSREYTTFKALYIGSLNPQGSGLALGLDSVMAGEFDELLGIPASSINGVWLIPYLCEFVGTGDSGSVIIPSDIAVGYRKPKNDPFFVIQSDIASLGIEQTVNPPMVSTEKEKIIVVDYDGSKLLTIPPGMSISGIKTKLIFEPTSVYYIVSMKDGYSGRTEGMVAVSIPPTLAINTNAQSDYEYSGQREYDRQQRMINSNANAWKTSAAGAGAGAMMGAFGPQGLLLGMGGGLAGGLISYGTEMLYQNDEEQRIMDRLKANQISGILMSSNVWAMVTNDKEGIRLSELTFDDYSSQAADNQVAQFGVSVDELSSSVDTLIRTTSPTGYYNIQNLIVSGDIPVSAKRWIRNKFASGVRLI